LELGWFRPKSNTAKSGSAKERFNAKYGRGRYLEELGIYEWYEAPESAIDELNQSGDSLTWEDILTKWELVVPDMRSEYGMDVATLAGLRAIPWRTLRLLIVGLVPADTRLGRAIRHDKGLDRPTRGR
jgi:hypothetical protein